MGIRLPNHKFREYLSERIEVARWIHSDCPTAIYADVAMPLCTILSTCAAERWPGKRGIDRKRFVELIVRYSGPELCGDHVSIPRLVSVGELNSGATPYGRPGQDMRIFCNDEVDLPFDEATAAYPAVPRQRLRKHSYACMLYELLRCGYAHQFAANKGITTCPPSWREAKVSYISRFANRESDDLLRMTHFHLEYLFELAEHHASILPSTCEPRPATWWIDLL